MPGVLIAEALAQVGGVLARLSVPGLLEKDERDKNPIFFISMNKVKFRRPVVPGDQLRLEAEALRSGSRIWKMAGKAFVGENLAVEGEFVATIG